MSFIDGVARCDMRDECAESVTYIDEKGFVYCTAHGQLRQRYHRCRKLRPHELRKVLRGASLPQY